ncbi:TPA: hypothetical protein ACJEU7_003033 [Acinetobacter baumannii]
MINFGFVLRKKNDGTPDFIAEFKKGKISNFPLQTKATFKRFGERPTKSYDEEQVNIDFDLDLTISDTFLLPCKLPTIEKDGSISRTFDDGLAVFKGDLIPFMHVSLSFKARVKVKGIINKNPDYYLVGHKVDSVDLTFDDTVRVIESLVNHETRNKETYRTYNSSLVNIIDPTSFYKNKAIVSAVEHLKCQLLLERELIDFLRDLQDSRFMSTYSEYANAYSCNIELNKSEKSPVKTVIQSPKKSNTSWLENVLCKIMMIG